MTTDEAESHQKKPRQQEEAGQDARPPSPEEEQLRPRNRNSVGRGLSRLFSSFLKRRSQCESEAGEKEGKEEEEAKAPIADPEPELRTEGEVALDQHSVSSAEAQVSLHVASKVNFTTQLCIIQTYSTVAYFYIWFLMVNSNKREKERFQALPLVVPF